MFLTEPWEDANDFFGELSFLSKERVVSWGYLAPFQVKKEMLSDPQVGIAQGGTGD